MSALRPMRRLARDRRGATIMEFGLILAPLCVVLLGAFDLGYQSYVRSVLQGVLNDVARAASVEAPEFAGEGETLEERIAENVEERVNSIARNATYDIDQTNFYEFAGVGRAEKLMTDVNDNGQYDPGDCFEDLNDNGQFDLSAGRAGRGGADDVVFYEVTVTMPRMLPVTGLIGLPDEYNIVARAAIRNQPYTRQNVPQTVCA